MNNTPQDRFEHTIDGLIDLETGELIDEQLEQIKFEDLPRIARALRRIRRDVESAKAFQQAEMKRIQAACLPKRLKLAEQEGKLLTIARDLMEKAGEKSLHYPGLGKLLRTTTRAKVDDDLYQSLRSEEQKCLQKGRPDIFRTTTTIAPNKKEILIDLQGGAKLVGFALLPAVPTLRFTPDKEEL